MIELVNNITYNIKIRRIKYIFKIKCIDRKMYRLKINITY